MKLKLLKDSEFLHMLTTIESSGKENSKIRLLVIKALRKEKCDPEFASPNFVSDFANNRGFTLSSDDIVWISDNYQG